MILLRLSRAFRFLCALPVLSLSAIADEPLLSGKAADILKVYAEMRPKTKTPAALATLKTSVCSVLDAEIAAEEAKDKKSPVYRTLVQRRIEVAPLDLLKCNLHALKPEVDGLKVSPGLPLTTPCFLSPPIKLEATVKATKGNLRLLAGANEIIFGWERDPNDIRINSGPAHRRHVKNQGQIPANSFFTVEQEITDTMMILRIDGKERAKWVGDFSKIREDAGFFTWHSELLFRQCTVSGKVSGFPK